MMKSFDFNVRFASRGDLQWLDSCNRESLPENYPRSLWDRWIGSTTEGAHKATEIVFVAEKTVILVKQKHTNATMSAKKENQVCENRAGYIVVSKKRSLNYGVGHVVSLAVLPQYRRCGVGSALLRAGEEAWPDVGVFTLYVRPTNYGAMRLYIQTGYKRHDRRKKYYEDGEDALVLRRPLVHKEVHEIEQARAWNN